jgi:hypothetical protein
MLGGAGRLRALGHVLVFVVAARLFVRRLFVRRLFVGRLFVRRRINLTNSPTTSQLGRR